jgi:hypothetical protein
MIIRIISALAALSILVMTLSVGISAQDQGGDQNETEAKVNEMDVGDAAWRIKDFKPYIKAIKELEKLNREYSENLLKLAIDEYATGLDILEDMENEIVQMRTQNKKKKFLNERFYWQEIDRKNREHRQIARKKYEAKMKAVTYFTRSIKTLDEVVSPDIRQDAKFINFQSRLYQVYVSTQYDLGNLKPCIPILERYVTLRDENKKDIWAYKYMASCYGYMENVLAKNRNASEDQIMKYKNLKNRSMLQAVELKYGVDSPHYKRLQEVVELDEKKSERINDFK